MNRIDRLSAILIQLQSKKIVKAAEIADRFGISLRTVYRDIRALEEAGVPIGAEAGVGYFISEGFFLPPVMFSEEEASAILLGAKLIERMSDDSIGDNFSSAMYKIKSVLKSSGKETLEELDSRIVVSKGLRKLEKTNHLSLLQKSIADKKTIEIKYYSNYRENMTNRVVEPIGLYYYSGAWHLIAYCRMRNDYRDFRVDRIKNLEITNESFNTSERKTLDEYIKTDWGFESEVKFAIINFSNKAAKFITNVKHYYGFVEEEKEENSVKMKFMMMDIEFFARWLLSFGNEIEIIEPAELMAKIKQLIEELNEHYLKIPLEKTC